MKRTKHIITDHGRQGRPVIHIAKTSGRRGGRTKRLYEGSQYHTGNEWRRLRL